MKIGRKMALLTDPDAGVARYLLPQAQELV
jgi:hypothetical protein